MNRDSELGGLWLKTSERTGKKFMTGRLTLNGEAVEVVLFKNEHKQPGERTPDYRVYRSQPRDGQQPQQRGPDQSQRRQSSIADDLNDEIPW